MIDIYNDFSFEASKEMTKRYSTSFTLGIRMLDKKLHNPIYGIYGLVRLADEIVDTFHDQDKATLLTAFRKETFDAIENKLSTNPIINAYQIVANRYGIENELTDAFFNSMEMDLHKIEYNESNYNQYIYGSAEVVGLMCMRVFSDGDIKLYEDLKPGAKALGAAFQKVNFLRDMQDDFEERGRTYFPNVDFIHFSEADKKEIEKDIEKDFEEALIYIKKLPPSARKGVYLAYKYYMVLFSKIQTAKSHEILKKRFSVPNFEKMLILLGIYVRPLELG